MGPLDQDLGRAWQGYCKFLNFTWSGCSALELSRLCFQIQKSQFQTSNILKHICKKLMNGLHERHIDMHEGTGIQTQVSTISSYICCVDTCSFPPITLFSVSPQLSHQFAQQVCSTVQPRSIYGSWTHNRLDTTNWYDSTNAPYSGMLIILPVIHFMYCKHWSLWTQLDKFNCKRSTFCFCTWTVITNSCSMLARWLVQRKRGQDLFWIARIFGILFTILEKGHDRAWQWLTCHDRRQGTNCRWSPSARG